MRYTNNWMIQGRGGELVSLPMRLRTSSKEDEHEQQCFLQKFGKEKVIWPKLQTFFVFPACGC